MHVYERRSLRRYLSAIFHQDVVRNNQHAMQRSIEHVDDATREHNLLSAFIRKRTLFYVLLSKQFVKLCLTKRCLAQAFEGRTRSGSFVPPAGPSRFGGTAWETAHALAG